MKNKKKWILMTVITIIILTGIIAYKMSIVELEIGENCICYCNNLNSQEYYKAVSIDNNKITNEEELSNFFELLKSRFPSFEDYCKTNNYYNEKYIEVFNELYNREKENYLKTCESSPKSVHSKFNINEKFWDEYYLVFCNTSDTIFSLRFNKISNKLNIIYRPSRDQMGGYRYDCFIKVDKKYNVDNIFYKTSSNKELFIIPILVFTPIVLTIAFIVIIKHTKNKKLKLIVSAIFIILMILIMYILFFHRINPELYYKLKL